MKKFLSAIVFASLIFTSCTSSEQKSVSENNSVTIQAQPELAVGFDVQLFADLVKKTSDPASIEKAINDPSTGINNLDLNKDGNVDFLKVTESTNTIQIIDNDVNPSSIVT